MKIFLRGDVLCTFPNSPANNDIKTNPGVVVDFVKRMYPDQFPPTATPAEIVRWIQKAMDQSVCPVPPSTDHPANEPPLLGPDPEHFKIMMKIAWWIIDDVWLWKKCTPEFEVLIYLAFITAVFSIDVLCSFSAILFVLRLNKLRRMAFCFIVIVTVLMMSFSNGTLHHYYLFSCLFIQTLIAEHFRHPVNQEPLRHRTGKKPPGQDSDTEVVGKIPKSSSKRPMSPLKGNHSPSFVSSVSRLPSR